MALRLRRLQTEAGATPRDQCELLAFSSLPSPPPTLYIVSTVHVTIWMTYIWSCVWLYAGYSTVSLIVTAPGPSCRMFMLLFIRMLRVEKTFKCDIGNLFSQH